MKNKSKKYECVFPECTYSTINRSKIDMHHITPRELDPSPRNKLTVPLCKTHHALIFHPEAKVGQHSIQTDASLQILGVYDSTEGKSILYESVSGRQFFYTPSTRNYIPN